MKLDQSRPVRLLSHALRYVEDNGVRGTAVHFYRRLLSSLGRNGLANTLGRTVRGNSGSAMPQTPEAPHPFDSLHGTDTGGPGRGYAIPGFFSNTYANGYLGIAPSALTQAISQLPLDPRDFTFIDLGCGKGRAVMVATQFPFRQIIGVEISPELCATARTNIARNPVWAGRISILEQDASTYTFPETPLLIFLYHPFLPPLLRRVLANLERQLRQTSRETWVIYADNPGYRVLERFTFLREIAVPSYLLSAEDRSAVEDDPTHQSMTVYVADLSR